MANYLTTHDVANRLHVTRATVRHWLRRGHLTGTASSKRGYLISEADLQTFLQQYNRVKSGQHHYAHTLNPSQTLLPSTNGQEPLVLDSISNAIWESVSDAIAVSNAQGIVVAANPAYYQLFGYTPDQVLSKPFSIIFAEHLQDSALEQYLTLFQEETIQPFFESTIRRSDGTTRIVEARYSFLSHAGQRVAMVSLIHDITDRKRTEQALLEKDEQLSLALETARLGSWQLDVATSRLDCTPQCKANFGLPPDGSPYGITLDAFLAMVLPEDRTQIIHAVEKALKEHTIYDCEYRIRWPDNTIHWITASGHGIYGSNGVAMRMVGMTLDITERKEREQRKDDYIGIASHELRAPLTAIKGNLQLVEHRLHSILDYQHSLPDGVASLLAVVSQLIERSLHQVNVQNRLIGDLLDVSRIQAEKLELILRPCNLVDIVREAIGDQHALFSERQLVLEIPTQPIPVLADADRISQVLNNYLTNAHKYSNAESPITVGISTESRYVRVWVRDKGHGLSAEAQQHIWERFYQAENTHVRAEDNIGLGLGLYICKTLISLHNGDTGVESSPEEGSTFWFSLPIFSA